MFAHSPDAVAESVPFADPVAMELLGGSPVAAGDLGAFSHADGLGIFGIDDALIASAIPFVQQAVRGIQQRGQAANDPISTIWQALPASAIGAKVGSDGWWYDKNTNARLSHEEAARRQQEITAATIGATVGSDGWWVKDGAQLSHAQAWQLYQQLTGIQPGTPDAGGNVPDAGTPVHTTGGTVAGIPTMAILGLVAAGALLLVVSRRRG